MIGNNPIQLATHTRSGRLRCGAAAAEGWPQRLLVHQPWRNAN